MGKQTKLPIPWDYESHMKAVAGRLLDQRHVAYDEIIDVENCTIYGGYCETCAYEAVGIRVEYRAGASVRAVEFEMGFQELMRM